MILQYSFSLIQFMGKTVTHYPFFQIIEQAKFSASAMLGMPLRLNLLAKSQMVLASALGLVDI